ncbi:MAG: HD domain-containing protein [Opitutales bacterium]
MKLPAELEEMISRLSRFSRPLLVGGCVRDWLLGLEPVDFDIEVFGTDFPSLSKALADFGPTDVVGKQFGVVKVRAGEREYDFSLPRTESKMGAGHRGFSVVPSPSLSLEQAASRRDFTINAIAYNPGYRKIEDPFDGQGDLEKKRLRHIGPAFVEDPLRVLRGFQLAGRFRLDLAPETARLCRSIRNAFYELPRERIWGEWEKWAADSTEPSRGIKVLQETGWLDAFPEVAALDEVPQDPEWHPEGDVLTHTKHCVDSLAGMREWREQPRQNRRDLMFAVLAHDLGKATTTRYAKKHGKMRWISHGHDAEGAHLADAFLRRIGAPSITQAFVPPLVKDHIYHVHLQSEPTPASIRRLAKRLQPATIHDLCIIMKADHCGRPPLPAAEPEGVALLQRYAHELHIDRQAPRPILLGRHLIAQGLKPGPHFGSILDSLFEAQLDGAFSNEEEGLSFLRNFLSKHDRLREEREG